MRIKLLTIVVICQLLLSSLQANAQQADTITVTGTGTNGALMPGDLYRFIEKDTLANGSRINPNRRYRLERGKVYVLNGQMTFRHDLYLIADNDNPKNPVRPPMIVNGKLPDGSNNLIQIALMTNNTKAIFKNIFFQGVTPGTPPKADDDNNAISLSADTCSVTLDGCVFNAEGANCLIIWGKHNKLYIKNNIFRNGVRPHPFKGQIIANSSGLSQDTVIITNNTVFNCNSYFWCPNIVVVNYEKLEHNTIYTSMVNTLFSPWMVNAEIKSNIFYSMLSYGQKQEEVTGSWYDWAGSLSSIISITKASAFQLGQHGFTEKGRKIEVSNNAYFWPQKIKDNWVSKRLIASDSWMNTRTAGFFADNTNYPYLSETNNLNIDPQFNTAMEKSVIDSVIFWVNNFRDNNKSTYRNYNVGSTNILLPTWPLPEKLAYSNDQLMTAGHDGLPLGDLNWFPTAKAQWELLNKSTSVQNIKSNPNFRLSNYPNPTSELTTFTFKLTECGNIQLRIFNLEGRQLESVLSGKYDAGTHRVEYNANRLGSGIFICELTAGNYSDRCKLVVK